MNPYQRDFQTDNPETWHDEAAQHDALEALEAGNMEALERVFHEARGISIKRIIREIIKEKL